MMILAIVGLSLLLQLMTVFFSLRLVLITGWTKAWVLISIGIATMGIRRLITFMELMLDSPERTPELGYELVGLCGSALMLCGVIFIKPVILSYMNAEKEQRTLAEKLHDALSRVKTLSGMLPICASCKKIRDDKGYWNQLEVYIRDHSDAEFSHGLCPKCEELAMKEVEEFTKSAKGS